VHVNAHATSTPTGDSAEARWIAELLGEQTVVTATKSMTGHLLGAAGAIEAIATVLSVRDDIVPPTINLDDPDDNVRVDVPREARKMPITAALNDSFGFGGHNAALLFRKA
jgi:3-oxoacyl-[acyl-carrier-protein] synthase II